MLKEEIPGKQHAPRTLVIGVDIIRKDHREEERRVYYVTSYDEGPKFYSKLYITMRPRP